MIKPISICLLNIRKWATNPRIYVIISLLFTIIYHFVTPLITICYNTGYRVTPWIFPFLIDNVAFQILIMLGIILLFCDAPFENQMQAYFLIRCNRVQWAIGQIMYIFISSLFYLLIVNIFIMIVLMQVIYISPEWGKVLSTMAQTNLSYMVRVFHVSSKIISSYTPLGAFFISFFLEWCCCIFIGLVIYIFNSIFNRFIGIIIASSMVLFDILIYAGLRSFTYHFSPISLPKLSILDTKGLSDYPTLEYALVILPIAIIILSIIAVIVTKKKKVLISTNNLT